MSGEKKDKPVPEYEEQFAALYQQLFRWTQRRLEEGFADDQVAEALVASAGSLVAHVYGGTIPADLLATFASHATADVDEEEAEEAVVGDAAP